jgi:soluble lytic murein transglycosylase-like protein
MIRLVMRKVCDRACRLRRLAWTSGLMLCFGLPVTMASDGAELLSALAAPREFPPPPAPVEALSAEIAAVAQDISERFHISQDKATEITRIAYRAAGSRTVKPTLILAVIAVESSYQPDAVNKVTGAVGLMQVYARCHPAKVRSVGGEQMLLLIEPNIQVGTEILAEYLYRSRGQVGVALGRYSGSSQADEYVDRVQVQMRHLSTVARRASKANPATAG